MSKTAAKKLSEKLAKLITSNFSVSEIKLYTKAEKADALSFDAMYLWVLKKYFGFTAEQLINVFSTVSKEAVQFEDYALSGDFIPLVSELKEFGVDIELLAREVY